MNDNLRRVVIALEKAQTEGDLNAAKALMRGLTIEGQFAVVDTAIAARRRLRGVP